MIKYRGWLGVGLAASGLWYLTGYFASALIFVGIVLIIVKCVTYLNEELV